MIKLASLKLEKITMDSAQTTHQTGSQTTSSHHALLWAGAAVSIAEILTGTYLAPLGWERGLLAIVIGHMIGGVLFFLVGYIGATQRKSAMETVKGQFIDFRISLEQWLLVGHFSEYASNRPHVDSHRVSSTSQQDLWSSVPQSHHLTTIIIK